MSTEPASPHLSLIIPALEEEGAIGELLVELAARFPGAERIVVDGGSRDGTVACAMAHADVVLLGSRGRAAQMNLGAAAARGDLLLFLHADTCPCFTGAELQAALDAPTRWGFFRVTLDSPRRALRVVAWFMNRRSRFTAVATGDQGLLVQRELLAQVGGYAPIPLMEDVELCKRLRSVATPRSFDLEVRTSARRWEQHGVVPTVLRMWGLRLAYWLGVSPQRLWRHYYGEPADSGIA